MFQTATKWQFCKTIRSPIAMGLQNNKGEFISSSAVNSLCLDTEETQGNLKVESAQL